MTHGKMAARVGSEWADLWNKGGQQLFLLMDHQNQEDNQKPVCKLCHRAFQMKEGHASKTGFWICTQISGWMGFELLKWYTYVCIYVWVHILTPSYCCEYCFWQLLPMLSIHIAGQHRARGLWHIVLLSLLFMDNNELSHTIGLFPC